MRGPQRFWLHDDGTISLKKPEPMTLDWLELVQLCELEKTKTMLDLALNSLNLIANANGNYHDEDYVTTTARDTLKEITNESN